MCVRCSIVEKLVMITIVNDKYGMGFQPGRTITKEYLQGVAKEYRKVTPEGELWVFWMAKIPFLYKEGESHCKMVMSAGPVQEPIIISTRGELVLVLRKMLSMWEALTIMRKAGGVEYMLEDVDLKTMFSENLRHDEKLLLQDHAAWSFRKDKKDKLFS